MNAIRPDVDREPKTAPDILRANQHGWAAVHAALVSAARQLSSETADLVVAARNALQDAEASGFVSLPHERRTRFCGMSIMAWQDALYVMNELPDWHFPDEVLCVGWMVECGGPALGRGPARADFSTAVSRYIQGTRNLFNAGTHGNGRGWPGSRRYRSDDCVHMRG
jgi:hypothetical protein